MKAYGSKVNIWLPAAIVLITLAVFSPVLRHDFVNLDDPVIVYANPHIQSGVTFEAIRWAFTSGYESNWIPLSWISHMMDIQLFGLEPAWHHLVNVLLHVASSVLLFLFLKRATGTPLRSAVVAVLFALHPLHVESVAWVAERKDVLSAFFWMLTVYAYIYYTEKPVLSRYLSVLGLFLLGLLSKPMVVTLPVVLLLLDWWPLGRFVSAATGDSGLLSTSPARLFAEKVPFFVLSAGSSTITYLVQQSAGEIVTGLTFLEKASRACISYVEYIYKMIWPVKLAVFYPFVESPPSNAMVLFSVFALVLVTGVAFWKRRRYPFLITGWLWYVVALLPVIGLVHIGQHSIADRYSYIPLIGLFVFIVWGSASFMRKWPVDDVVWGIVLAAALAVMIALTSTQLRYWKNTVTLLTHAIEVTENNWLALNNLGLAYFNTGRVDEALWLFSEAVKAKPSYVRALLNLGAAYSMKNDFAAAKYAFIRVLQFEPENEKAHLSLGLTYLQLGERNHAMAEYQALRSTGSLFAPHLLKEINAGGLVVLEH